VNSLPRVLIVDESSESREILRALLEHRGAATIEARRPEQAIPLAVACRPDVIVLDADSDHSADGRATADLQTAAGRSLTPIIILGTIRPLAGGYRPGQILSKPYHYGALIGKIEALLAAA
jgi:DNA-binding response OmpR family regulator